MASAVPWQDQCMKEEIDSRLAVSRLAVMAFVRITCARAGSAAKDWCVLIRVRVRVMGTQIRKAMSLH